MFAHISYMIILSPWKKLVDFISDKQTGLREVAKVIVLSERTEAGAPHE
jgi:hypothetical protein